MSEKVYREYDQCPICGDPLRINSKDTTKLLCECCGFQIGTKTEISDENKERLLQANEALRSYEFDRAETRYSLILDDINDSTNEVYTAALYGKLLSEFGIVYIKDVNGEMIPTFSEYDPSIKSIKDSYTYKSLLGLKTSDEVKTPYLEKINELDKVYRKIETELNKESLYDVFICTKISRKTPQNPKASGYTEDSRIADDFYYELKAKGLNVFYSDKSCNQVEYDSQIFSALLRSKKILIIATEKEYLESPWVQSEWRRWRNFIDGGVKENDSMVLFLPYYEKEMFELPRMLRKTQRYTRQLQVLTKVEPPKVEIKVEPKIEIKPKAEEKPKTEVKPKVEEKPKTEVKPNQTPPTNYMSKEKIEEFVTIARKYYRGDGVEKDYNIAYQNYKIAADNGHYGAQNMVGYLAENGWGTSKNLALAFSYYKMSADQGYDVAQSNLGLCYENGRGCKADYNEAFKYYKLAADQGNVNALNYLANCYIFGTGCTKNEYEAFKYHKMAADKGNKKAQNSVGYDYEVGRGCTKDVSLAFKYYKMSADQGHDVAQSNLGLCYENARGCAKDLVMAAKYYKLAADQGNKNAQGYLGNCYYNGKGVTKDYTLAHKYFKLAADQGVMKSQCSVGYDYEKGLGCTKDLSLAFKYYKMSADQGYDIAQSNVGYCYEVGMGCIRDYNNAYKYYKLAADQGNARGINSVGRCYENAWGVSKDLKQAIKYYKMSADKGYMYAQYNLGLCYEFGKGCFKNTKQAIEFYKQAARQGHEASKKKLQEHGIYSY